MSFFVSNISSREVLEMKKDERKKTTIRINPDVWELAGMKSDCSRNELIERLLTKYIAEEGSRQDLERKIKECEQIIREEKTKISEYKRAIKEIEKQEAENKENRQLLKLCYDKIDRYMRTHKTMQFAFIKSLSNRHKVDLTTLNEYCLEQNFKFE